jgi:opacity protein-like surface antigen
MKLRMMLFLTALGVAGPLQAQTYLTPNIGMAFGGDLDDSRISYGGTLTFTGDVPVGFAIDFAYTPDFLGTVAFGKSNATSLMGNLVLISNGRVRIYGSAGVGLMKTRVEDVSGFFEIDSNEFGFNAGGGFIFAPNRLGIQGDVRYFRNLTDPEPDNEFDVDLGSLSFWRASGGIVFRF